MDRRLRQRGISRVRVASPNTAGIGCTDHLERQSFAKRILELRQRYRGRTDRLGRRGGQVPHFIPRDLCLRDLLLHRKVLHQGLVRLGELVLGLLEGGNGWREGGFSQQVSWPLTILFKVLQPRLPYLGSIEIALRSSRIKLLGDRGEKAFGCIRHRRVIVGPSSIEIGVLYAVSRSDTRPSRSLWASSRSVGLRVSCLISSFTSLHQAFQRARPCLLLRKPRRRATTDHCAQELQRPRTHGKHLLKESRSLSTGFYPPRERASTAR